MSASALNWSDLDYKAVDTVRALAVDAVEKCGNGHPGTAMSLAPAAYLLFQQVMQHDPADPNWAGRDRFVLSCGHSSLSLYIQLFLSGYEGMTLDQLKQLRQWGSLTPGHPEYGHTPGVEATTGPLGQGIAMAVGMAAAARRERGLFDPDAPPGASPFDHNVYVICSDGDIQEGISHEASALAGHQQLGNLIVFYDENEISIEDDTAVALSEDVAARYAAYGWHTQTIDWRGEDGYNEDVGALFDAINEAKEVTDKPSFISLRTIIGWPAPTKQNTGAIHGSKLGADEAKATKEILGFAPDRAFDVDDKVLSHARGVGARGKAAHARWQEKFDAWAQANPQRHALFQRLSDRALPEGWEQALPSFDADDKGIATRAASGKVLSALAQTLPELWGGSADLAGSNNTTMDGEPSFLPKEHSTKMFDGNPFGRTWHFGVREHAMAAISNGIALHGRTRPYAGTFLVFSDYMRPAVRLSALMQVPVTYVWTHDSIGLGEDGPTHQPVEHLASLRAIPGLDVVRPADANETVWAWRRALETADRPTALALTRQAVPTVDRTTHASAEGVARGGYVLVDADKSTPDVIIIATGSEVAIALQAKQNLATEGISARVVSMPCREWFDSQDADYRDSVLPATVRSRVSVEAGIAMPWRDLIGDAGVSVSIEDFGASAPYQRIYEEYGITADNVVAAAKRTIANAAP
ncbi:MAG TPA: transketolase [Candidatus Stackebrandtia faecavium]|nr:transketolase [Candidatus Stackebrandtia faecavium]